jgi:hypothetical protein
MVRDQKMAFTGRNLPKYIQIYFISAFENSLNSLPSETAVNGKHRHHEHRIGFFLGKLE